MIALVVVGLSCLAFSQAATIDINQIVDEKLQLANRLSLLSNRSYVEYGSGFMSVLSYEGAVGIGLDSIFRTGDCSMTFTGTSIEYVYNIGQAILATFFRKMTYQDVSGSGYYKAVNNSLQYSYKVNYGRRCEVRLQSLELTMENIEAYVQDKSWNSNDDPEFETFVKDVLLPTFNNKLQDKSSDIESRLETVFCQTPAQEQPTQGLDILFQFLFE